MESIKFIVLILSMLLPHKALAFIPTSSRIPIRHLVPKQTPTFPPRNQLKMMEMPLHDITDAYSNLLKDEPFLTKGTTGLVLCGIGDLIAQVRGFELDDASTQRDESISSLPIDRKIDTTRLIRFAAKGFFGTSIWSAWYDYSDTLVSTSNVLSALSLAGISDASESVLKISKVAMLMTVEQFICCPIIYGLWEIPVSTILNGAPISRIPYEMKDKLTDMLIDSAKIWTFGNIIIYSSPVEYRTAIANLGDIFWQSIVSDISADCGSESDECAIDDQFSVTIIDDDPSSLPDKNGRNHDRIPLLGSIYQDESASVL